MTPDLEVRMAHRRDEAAGHGVLVETVAVVDARDDDIELREDLVRVVEPAVGGDVGPRTPEDPERAALLDRRDLIPLLPEALDRQAAGVARACGVIGDGEEHPASRLR